MFWEKGTVLGLSHRNRVLFLFALVLILNLAPLSAQETAPEMPSPTYDLFFSKGLSHINQKEFQESAQELERALLEKPDDAGAMHYLGVALGKLEKYQEAEDLLLRSKKRDPYDNTVYFDLGVVQYRLKKYEEALRSFDLAESVDELNRPMVYYYQGLLHHRLKGHDQAVPRFLRAVALAPELGLTAHYYSGVGYYRLGRWQEASGQFDRSIAVDPTSNVAASAQKFLEALEDMDTRTQGTKRWHVSLQPAYQYDSNVILLEKSAPLPAGISRQEDHRLVILAKGGLRIAETERIALDADYDFYQSLHNRLSHFDVQAHTLRASATLRRHRRTEIDIPYTFHDARVDGERFSRSHALKPTLIFRGSSAGATRLQVGVEQNDFSNTPFFPTNNDRDAVRYVAGVSQSGAWAGQGHLRVGYQYDQNKTGDTPTEDDWAYQGHAISGALGRSAFERLWFDLLADYTLHRYQNPHSASPVGDQRVDRIQSYTATLSGATTRWVTLALQYLFSRSRSNIEVFSYDRHVVSVIASVDF